MTANSDKLRAFHVETRGSNRAVAHEVCLICLFLHDPLHLLDSRSHEKEGTELKEQR